MDRVDDWMSARLGGSTAATALGRSVTDPQRLVPDLSAHAGLSATRAASVSVESGSGHDVGIGVVIDPPRVLRASTVDRHVEDVADLLDVNDRQLPCAASASTW